MYLTFLIMHLYPTKSCLLTCHGGGWGKYLILGNATAVAYLEAESGSNFECKEIDLKRVPIFLNVKTGNPDSH